MRESGLLTRNTAPDKFLIQVIAGITFYTIINNRRQYLRQWLDGIDRNVYVIYPSIKQMNKHLKLIVQSLLNKNIRY